MRTEGTSDIRRGLVKYPVLAVFSLFVCALAALNKDWFFVGLAALTFLWSVGNLIVLFVKMPTQPTREDDKGSP